MSVINPIIVQSGGSGGETPYLIIESHGWADAGCPPIVRGGWSGSVVLATLDGSTFYSVSIFIDPYNNVLPSNITVSDGRSGTPTFYGDIHLNGTLKGTFSSSISQITIPQSDFLSEGNILAITPSNENPI